MSLLFNRAGMKTVTGGTGTITLGSALASGDAIFQCAFQSFASAGVADTNVVSYLILDSNGAWEYGTGTYTASGTTLSRTLGQSSTGSLLNLTGNSQVFLSPRQEDVQSKSESQAANTVWASPNGSSGAPSFRALVGADIPTATQSDQETATSTTVFVTPGRQHFHPSATKFWVFHNDGTTINASYNVTSITDNGAGDHTVNFTVSFSSTNYSVGGVGASGNYVAQDGAAPASNSCRFVHYNAAGTPTDSGRYFAQGWGDQ